MRMDKLTGKFQAALGDAQSLAVGRDQQLIEPAHVLLALLEQQGGTVRPLVLKAGANLTKLRTDLTTLVEQLPTVQGAAGDVHISNDLQRLLNVTDKLAQQRQDQFIASELFVLAGFEDRGVLARALKDAGLTKAAVEKAIADMRGGEKVNDANAEEQRGALDKYTVDLPGRAGPGKQGPVFGRDEESRRSRCGGSHHR